MQINGEEVELVEAFEQLRVADVVWVWPCPCPTGKHRALLTRRSRGLVRARAGRVPAASYTDYFDVLPPARPPCVPADSLGTTLTPDTVRERVIYRVVDPRKTTGEDLAQGQRDTRPTFADVELHLPGHGKIIRG